MERTTRSSDPDCTLMDHLRNRRLGTLASKGPTPPVFSVIQKDPSDVAKQERRGLVVVLDRLSHKYLQWRDRLAAA
jgi:hypothetical protein